MIQILEAETTGRTPRQVVPKIGGRFCILASLALFGQLGCSDVTSTDSRRELAVDQPDSGVSDRPSGASPDPSPNSAHDGARESSGNKREQVESLILDARRLLLQRDLDAARAKLDAAILLDGSSAEAYLDRGLVNLIQGKLESAERDYTRVLQIDPSQYRAHVARGRVFSATGKFDRAREEFDRAVTLAGDDNWARYARGCFLFDRGDVEEALQDAEAILQADPSERYGYILRANCRRAAGDASGESADWDRAAELKLTGNGVADAPTDVTCASWSADGARFLLMTSSGRVLTFRSSDLALESESWGPKDIVDFRRLEEDGVSVGVRSDHVMLRWSADGQSTPVKSARSANPNLCLLSGSGRRFVRTWHSGEIEFGDPFAESGERETAPADGACADIALSPGGELAILILSESRFEIRDIANDRRVQEWTDVEAEPGCLGVSESPIAAIYKVRNGLRIREFSDGAAKIRNLVRPGWTPTVITICQTKPLLATSDAGGGVAVWDYVEWRLVSHSAAELGHNVPLRFLLFSPEGSALLAARRHGSVHVYQVK